MEVAECLRVENTEIIVNPGAVPNVHLAVLGDRNFAAFGCALAQSHSQLGATSKIDERGLAC